MKFIDTNIVVYAADNTDVVKQRIARSILLEAIVGENFLISAQVLNEFANVAMTKLKRTELEVKAYLEKLHAVRAVPVLPSLTERAIDIKAQYGLQFYDSLLLATAEANGCDEFITEDLNDGQLYCGIKAVNPFIGRAA